jgi:hypothetical protein
MKNFNPQWDGPLLKYSDAPYFGVYTCIDGLVNYSFRVDIEAVEEWGDGPYSVQLPKAPMTDYVLRNGGFYLNGGMQIPLLLLAKAGERTAYLGYVAQNGEDIPITSKIPSILRAKQTFFYSSGSYFTLDGED